MKFLKNKKILCILITAIVIIGAELLAFGPNLKHIIKINSVLRAIDKNFYYEFDKDELVDYALSGIAYATKDDYTNYFSKDFFKAYKNESESSYMGIGIILDFNEDKTKVVVSDFYDDSSAKEAGILIGDIILKINDEDINPENLYEVLSKVSAAAEEGTFVKITVLRNERTFTVDIENRRTEKKTVKSEIIDGKIGYIKLSSFDRKSSENKDIPDSAEAFIEAVSKIREENIDKLIIDLRNNSGGDMQVCTKIADYLLPKGVIVYTEDKNGRKKYIKSDRDYVEMDIVVLVNGESASASEVLAGALRKNKDAKIVGEKTFGKGIIQSVYFLRDKTGFSLTTAEYFLSDGQRVHKEGITPDYVVTPDDSGKDNQLLKAIELIY